MPSDRSPVDAPFSQFENRIEELQHRNTLKWEGAHFRPNGEIRLDLAEMDLIVPPFVNEAIADAVRSGRTGYATTGAQEEALVDFLRDYMGVDSRPSAVRSTTDVLAGLRAVLWQMLPHDARVMVESPVFGEFWPVIREANCVPVDIPLRSEEGTWRHDWQGLEEAARDGCSAWLLSSPHNPVGRLWDEDELSRAVELARRHDILLISNEVHLPLARSQSNPLSVLSLSSARSTRVIVLTSASKSFNVAGLKSAFVVASEKLGATVADLRQGLLGRPGILGTAATVACLRDGQGWLDDLRVDLDQAARDAVARLRALPVPVEVQVPEATYLAWFTVPPSVQPSVNLALAQSGIRLTPGSAFGGAYPGSYRINFATHPAVLAEAFARLAAGLVQR